MDAQQEYFTHLKQALIDKGYDVYDNKLPPESTPYPFIYLAETRQNGYGVKAQEAGYITQVVQVWGKASQRGTISEINRIIRQTANEIQGEYNAFNLIPNETEQQIINDNTTKTPLMQGFTSLRLFYSRR